MVKLSEAYLHKKRSPGCTAREAMTLAGLPLPRRVEGDTTDKALESDPLYRVFSVACRDGSVTTDWHTLKDPFGFRIMLDDALAHYVKVVTRSAA